ncbi:MAG: cell envelope biogenesis protein OmpA [Nitrospirae bacterium]|nr:cell envelope biogenesis protein OmpA [Nitrospirota bacterium]
MVRILLLVPIIFVFLAGCAARGGPVLYPNAHLNAVGKEQAEIDIRECERLANEYIKTNSGGDVAGSTAAGGAAGAFVGGSVGAVTGNIGKGAGVGGAAGAAGGLVRGISKSSKPSQVYKNFVSRCLREKGYEPIGWQ